jgi:hypothetical protein
MAREVRRPLRPATCRSDWDFPTRRVFLSRNAEGGATGAGTQAAGSWGSAPPRPRALATSPTCASPPCPPLPPAPPALPRLLLPTLFSRARSAPKTPRPAPPPWSSQTAPRHPLPRPRPPRHDTWLAGGCCWCWCWCWCWWRRVRSRYLHERCCSGTSPVSLNLRRPPLPCLPAVPAVCCRGAAGLRTPACYGGCCPTACTAHGGGGSPPTVDD